MLNTNTIQNEIISYETAVMAKDKGFKIICDQYYSGSGQLILKHYNPYIVDKSCSGAYAQSLLQKWLREVHKIDVLVGHQFLQESQTPVIYEVCVTTGIYNTDSDMYCNYGVGVTFPTYEQALESGLQQALKLI